MLVTLQDALDRFFARYDNENTLRIYRTTLEPFARDFGPQRAVESFTDEDIDAWDARVRSASPRPAQSTVMTRRRSMKVFWNWSVGAGLVNASPARHLRLKRQRVSMSTRAIPNAVLQAMLDAVRHKVREFTRVRDTAILSLIATHAVRAGGIADLPLASVNIAERWIVYHTKGATDIRLPIPTRTGEALRAWLDLRSRLEPAPPTDRVFVTSRNAPITATAVGMLVRRLATSVCGVGYGPHSIRHFVCQTLADRRYPPTAVQAIAGHASVKTTLEYYYNQDYPRLQRILEETELGQAAQQVQQRPDNLVHVDFSQRPAG
jgi:site-specific recombinase XerC